MSLVKGESVLAAYPDLTALVSRHQQHDLYGINTATRADDSCLRWSFKHLELAVGKLSEALQQRGVQCGDVIVGILGNGVEALVLSLAAFKLGCVYAPLPFQRTINTSEFEHVLNLLTPSVLVVQDGNIASQVDRVLSRVPTVAVKIVCSCLEEIEQLWLSLEQVMNISSEPLCPQRTSASQFGEDVVAVLFTSGTTTLPKAVPYTNKSANV